MDHPDQQADQRTAEVGRRRHVHATLVEEPAWRAHTPQRRRPVLEPKVSADVEPDGLEHVVAARLHDVASVVDGQSLAVDVDIRVVEHGSTEVDTAPVVAATEGTSWAD